MDWREIYQEKLCTVDEAVEIVRDGDVIHIGTASGVAKELAEALYRQKDRYHHLTISSGVNSWNLPFYQEEKGGIFSVQTFFAGPAERMALKKGNCDYTSLHLSNIDQWCRDRLKDGVAFISVSPPDENGYMSYGTFTAMHDDVRKAVSRVVAEVNENMPYVYGMQNLIHVSQVDRIAEANYPLAEVPDLPVSDVEQQISQYIVDRISDGDTIQLGLGGLSGAIGYGLKDKNDLGVHSEMLTNSMRWLTERGVITNRNKNYNPDKAVVGFAYGPIELYSFCHCNPNLMFAPFTYVNNPYEIAKNDNMISVNTAMSVDLYGQVAADNLEYRQQSAVGGQVDFVRGAQMSKGGKSFIALPSTIEKNGVKKSRIVLSFDSGTAITTSRHDVQHIVTEYGCINLKPLNLSDRVKALISLAHPDFREELTDQAKDHHLI